MRFEFFLMLVCLAVAVKPDAASAGQTMPALEKKFTVPGRPAIVVRNVLGDTRVSGDSSSEVTIRVVKEVRHASNDLMAQNAAAQVEVRFEQVGNRLEIEARYPKSHDSSEVQVLVNLDVTAPVASDLDARAASGALEVHGINGRIQLSATEGDLTASKCSGRIEARAVDGSLQIEDARGEVSARTADGRLSLDGIFSAVRAEARDGRIAVRARQGSRAERAWSIRSRDGDVEIFLPEGFPADVQLTTADGEIDSEHAIDLGRSKSPKKIIGKLYGGGNPLRIQTADGNITLAK